MNASTLIRAFCAVVVSVSCALGISAAHAQATGDWTKLTPSQQTALAPLQGKWSTFSDAQKKKWLAFADERYGKLDSAGQARAQSQMQAWATMSPEERKTARENFNKARTLPPEARQAKAESFQQLPPERREKLAAQAEASKKGGDTPPAVLKKQTKRAASSAEDKAASNVQAK